MVSVIVVIVVAFFISQSIAKPIVEISSVMVKLGEGDLTVKVSDASTNDEVGLLTTAVKQTVKALKNLIGQVGVTSENVSVMSEMLASSSQEISSSTTQITASVDQMAKGARMQSVKVEDTANVMEEMRASVTEVSAFFRSGCQSCPGYR